MKYINQKSNRGIVNLFADFVLKEINKDKEYDTTIEVTDCGRFFVINGMTNSENILNITTVKEDFVKENKTLLTIFGYEHINVIDLILYKQELVKKDEQFFTLYGNSDRPLYHQKVIDLVEKSNENFKYHSINYTNKLETEIDFSQEDTSSVDFFTYNPLTITSEFPHGHSLSMGRLNLYYSEYIANQIFDVINATEMVFKFSLQKNKDEDFNISIKSDGIYKESDIKSMVLDVFDFNIGKFESMISGYDIYKDITEPFQTKPWLVRDKVKDLILF